MTTEIEKTKRGMYHCLDRIRRAGKHRVLTAEFEERLEEHLEELRKEESAFQARIGELYSSRQQWEDIAALRLDNLSAMTEERDQIQGRLHAVDHAYSVQSMELNNKIRECQQQKTALDVSGEQLREYQALVAKQASDIASLKDQVEHRDQTIMRYRNKDSGYLQDCQLAEKLSDELSEKLTHATTVIGQQERLIVGQRKSIADMHTELTHSRAIRKALICAQGAFRALDDALHGEGPYKAQKALGDDLVDAEWKS